MPDLSELAVDAWEGAAPPCQYKDKSPQASSAAASRWRKRPLPGSWPSGQDVIEIVLPRHVRACVHSPDRRERWAVWTWTRSNPAVQQRSLYQCNSWRCPVCARHEAAVTFARIKEATSRPEFDPTGWCYFVLTLDRNGYYSGEPWPDVTTAYRALGKMSERFIKRLRRMHPEIASNWVAVVEAHRSGWPHLNLMCYCPELASELRAERSARRRSGASKRDAILIGGALRDHAVESGWGEQSTAEGARSVNALAGYIVKLAGQHDASVGEVAKITQAPTAAPERFRRLRPGKYFLPARRKNPNTTGCLVRRRRAAEGDWQISSVNASSDPEQAEHIEFAIAAEQNAIEAEETELSRGETPRRMRLAVGGKLTEPRDDVSDNQCRGDPWVSVNSQNGQTCTASSNGQGQRRSRDHTAAGAAKRWRGPPAPA